MKRRNYNNNYKVLIQSSRLRVFRVLKFRISRLRLPVFSAMVSVKRHQPSLQFLNRIVYTMGGKITPNYSKLNKLYLFKLNLLFTKGGMPLVVKYLKVASICVQQVIAGHKLVDLTPLGLRISRDKTGLPRIIPSFQRKLIRQGNVLAIKYWLTLLSLYRDLHFSGVLKLKTITEPSSASMLDLTEISSLITSFKTLYLGENFELSSVSFKVGLFPILKSSPQVRRTDNPEEHSSHPDSIRRSYLAFHSSWEGVSLCSSLLAIATLTNNQKLLSLWNWCKLMKWDKVIPSHLKYTSFLGKLSTKEEAAGKVRVFAMVDPWTQWALRPIHKFLESLLRKLPCDGTFNQLEPLKRVPWGKSEIYSFDLSAATDRLPMSLQTSIIQIFFGIEFAEHWRALLVDRRYKTPKPGISDKWILPPDSPEFVYYKAGQPMGAYSSWTMLAVTHHYLVHYCAWTVGSVPVGTPFTSYAVLGDDIVIWDAKVANQYLLVMSKLGVEVGLAKSVISLSGRGLEFAKKTLLMGSDVSPVPFREQIASHQSAYALMDFMKKYSMEPLAALRFLGFGYKVDPSKKNMINHVLTIIGLIPKTAEELKLLFRYQNQFLDLTPVTAPKAELFSLQVRVLYEDLLNIKKTSRENYWKLLTKWTDLQVRTSPVFPGGSTNLVVTEKVWEASASKTLSDLDSMYQTSKIFLAQIAWTYEFTQSPMWDVVWLPVYQFTPRKLNIYTTFVVKSWTDLSALQLDSMTSPVPKFVSGQRGLERTSTLKYWNHWSRRMNQILLTKST